MFETALLLCPRNERRLSINDFWPRIIESASAVQQHCAMVELSAAFLGENGCDNLASISKQWASTTSGLAFWEMHGLCGDIMPWLNYRPPFLATMLLTTSSKCPTIERQWSVNEFRPCILEYWGAMGQLWFIIELSATFLGKNAYDMIVTMSQNERQWSVNDLWSCLLENPTAMVCR